MPSLSAMDFARLGKFINERTGIKVTDAKKTLFESRLQKRIRRLGVKDFGEYCDFLFNGEDAGAEIGHLIDAVTTHKTEFFREPGHFDFLADIALPELMKAGRGRRLAVWSAACSTGEEPYTIAMVLSDYGSRSAAGNLDFFTVLATDISNGVLLAARNAVYREEQVLPIPVHMRKKYLLRSKDRTKRMVRIGPELRKKVRFGAINLIEDDLGCIGTADIVFCRNVVIYFDRDVQQRLLRRIYGRLAPGGYLFMGHSEAIHGLGLPLAKVGPSVYRKK